MKVYVKVTLDNFGRMATFPVEVTDDMFVQDIKEEIYNKTGIPHNKIQFSCYRHGMKVYMVETQLAKIFLTQPNQTIFTQILPFEVKEIKTRTISANINVNEFISMSGLGGVEPKVAIGQ
jgi:hypothetical protein